MTYESTKERISQFVAEVEVEPRANSGSPYQLNIAYMLILCFGLGAKWMPKEKCGKRRNLLPKISSTKTEQLTDLLSSVLLYNPRRRITAASLAKHPWFVESVGLEVSGSGKSQKCKPC